jgi:hypothetical protein
MLSGDWNTRIDPYASSQAYIKDENKNRILMRKLSRKNANPRAPHNLQSIA